MPADAVLKLQGVTKFYGEKLVFRNLNFTGWPGQLYLILGANGSGKSTLLRVMAGLARPSSGIVTRVAGLRKAYLGHATFLYGALTAMQNLRFWNRALALGRGEEELIALLERVELAAHAHEKVRVFSRGMAQRLSFARCLLPQPQLLLLDEPFTGLDERSQSLLAAEINELKQSGACIALVSHSPQTDAKLADHVFMISGAQLQEKALC